ncbi:MAG: variant-type mycofactocin precursor [Syntrophobacteraceae bacterium]|nr:variant-type mycofactocin precursor [Syntrophobacteraceae bacterium]
MGTERRNQTLPEEEQTCTEPWILDEVIVEELAVDGICGVY